MLADVQGIAGFVAKTRAHTSQAAGFCPPYPYRSLAHYRPPPQTCGCQKALSFSSDPTRFLTIH